MRLGRKKARRIPIERALRLYWKLHACKKPSRKSYATTLRRIGKFFRGRLIDTISYLDIRDYRDWRGKSVGGATINREHTVIIHLFNALGKWADMGIIDPVTLPRHNPGSLIRKAPEPPRKRILIPWEIERLLGVAPAPLRRILVMAFNTALRLRDLRLLTWANVNQVTNQLEGFQTKTGKPYRIPINTTIRGIMDGGRLDFTNFRRQFHAARIKAEMPDIQFRDIRRTAARALLKGGFDIATVSSFLGHTSIRMTQVYVQPEDADKKTASDFLGARFS